MNREKKQSNQILITTLLKVGILTFIGTILVIAGILFAINLSNNTERKFTDLYLLLIIAYFISGVVTSYRCSQYTSAIGGSTFNLLGIVITFLMVLVLWYSLIPVSDFVANFGERHLQLMVSEPENLQNIRGLSINALISFAIGWGVTIFR